MHIQQLRYTQIESSLHSQTDDCCLQLSTCGTEID